MAATVARWMTPDPVRIEPGAAALSVLDLMIDRGMRHVPVVTPRGELVGVVTLDDVRAALPFPVSLHELPSPPDQALASEYSVGELMTHAPRTVRPETPVAEAARLMAGWRIGCLPVLDASGKLVGIFTETDALEGLAAELERGGQRAQARQEYASLLRTLRAERWRILRALDARVETERRLSAEQHDVPMDDPERGSDLQGVGTEQELAGLAARRFEALTRALDRAAQGRLGSCESCGGDIPVARLRALPGTTLCVACARSAEQPRPRENPAGELGWVAEEAQLLPGRGVHTPAGEGRLLGRGPWGTCGRCGEVEGRYDEQTDEILCSSPGCDHPLTDVAELALVQIGEETLTVEPEKLRPVDARPYD